MKTTDSVMREFDEKVINLGTYIQGEKETLEEVAERVQDDAIKALRPTLPEYARKIAAKMYPQIIKREYSQWEVERLLVAVCAKASEINSHSLAEARREWAGEVEKKMKKLKPRGFGFDADSMNMGYMMAKADVKHLLTGDNPEEAK